MNKKGFVVTGTIILAAVIAVVILIATVAFLVSGTLRWILIGVGVFVGVIWLMGQAMASNSGFTKNKLIVIGILVLVGIFFIFGSKVLQTTFTGLPGLTTTEYQETAIPCTVVDDCPAFLKTNNVEQSNIDKIDFKCEKSVCLFKLKEGVTP